MVIRTVNILEFFVLVQYETMLSVRGRVLSRVPVSPAESNVVKAHVPQVSGGSFVPVGSQPNAIR